MAVILLVMVLSLLVQGVFCSIGQTKTGCEKWNKNGDNVCCEACHPGNRLVRKCGLIPKELCTPCEPGRFTVDPLNFNCGPCTQCVGALFQLEACTATKDTKCGCKEGLTCGDDHCSFCVEKCGKGQEPTKNRSCRPCPEKTFNDQIHQMCKPWTTKCNPGAYIVTKATAFNDIKCTNVSVKPSHTEPDNTGQEWSLVWSVFLIMSIMGIVIIIIIIMSTVAMKILWKKKKTKKTQKNTKVPIIRTPTDDPRTLIAIECSFHEAQQEQGSSTESLDSKESSDQLIP